MKRLREGPPRGFRAAQGLWRGSLRAAEGGPRPQETAAPHDLKVCPGQSSLLGAGSGQLGELRQPRPRRGGPRLPQAPPGMRDSAPLSGARLPCLLEGGFSGKPSRWRGRGFRVYQTSHLGDNGENRMVLPPAWTPE